MKCTFFFLVMVSAQGHTNSLWGLALDLKPIFQLLCFCAYLGLSEVCHKSSKVSLCVKLWVKISLENLGTLYQNTSEAKFCCCFPQVVSKQASHLSSRNSRHCELNQGISNQWKVGGEGIYEVRFSESVKQKCFCS